MEEDKKLKELLQQWAVADTPDDFTQSIMHRIEANAATKRYAPSLLKNRIIRGLAAAFILVFVVLLILSINNQSTTFHFTSAISSTYISQLISFIIVFWIVMVGNQLYQWKSKRLA